MSEFSTIDASEAMKGLERIFTIDKMVQVHLNKIVCAANLFDDGVIVIGARHYDTIMHATIDLLGDKIKGRPIQGFIDKFGVFHTRKEAWKIAVQADQIFRRCGGDDKDNGTLYSENLY